MRLRLLALCLALLCPPSLLAQQPANPVETEKLAENAPRATPDGVTFTAPAEDVDDRLHVIRQDMNYSMVPVRPAGGVWTSSHDLAQYVVMELGKGMLPGGKRYISEENLMARRAPQVKVGEDIDYGMGLIADKRWGVPVLRHGGDMFGVQGRPGSSSWWRSAKAGRR